MLKKVLIAIGALLLFFAIGCICGHRNALKMIPEPKADTLFVRDTSWDYNPEKTVLPTGFELVPLDTLQNYSIMVNKYESTITELKDSLERKPKVVYVNGVGYISVPISKYNFTDHKTYECEATGYDVKMIWHKSIKETKYITKTTTIPTLPKIAISPDLSLFVTPGVFFVGGGAKLDIWAGNWRFSPGIDYGMIWSCGQWSHGPAFTFSTSYNFIIK